MTTTTTTYHLRAVTDELAARTHLGATEKGNRTWCGVDLLVKDDPRFGGRYKDAAFTASTDLETVDCGACKRGAAWKGRKGSTYAVPGPKVKAAPEARELDTQVSKPPSTRKRPSAATRAAATVANIEAAVAEVTGESVIEADPETGLPRIKPEVQAKADAIVAAQEATNAEAKR